MKVEFRPIALGLLTAEAVALGVAESVVLEVMGSTVNEVVGLVTLAVTGMEVGSIVSVTDVVASVIAAEVAVVCEW
jgi:hypothetical protein